MIAIFGLPGLELFRYRRVANRAEGEKWLDARLAELGESQQSLSARGQSRVISEREARTWRWQSGKKIFRQRGSLADMPQAVVDALLDPND